MRKIITLAEREDLFIDVYHIGYSTQGESCVFILYTAAKKVLYSLAIDCFEEMQINITDEILKEWKLEKKLNMFIWTHPHDDHSVGVERIVKKYCGRNSIICMANVIGMKEKCSQTSKKNIEYIQTLTKRKAVRNKWKVNSLAHFSEVLNEIYFNGESDLRKVSVQCIAPFPELGGMECGKIRPDFNMMGIGCILQVDFKGEKINFLFAGDMELYTIERLMEENDESLPTVYNYIKIPHHGSRNAGNMVEFLKIGGGSKSEFASSTVFVNRNLPAEDVLDAYRGVVERLGCTSDIREKDYGLGVIKVTYDLEARKVEHNFYGKAGYV